MTSSFRRSAVVISFDGAVDLPDAANGIGVTRLANKTYRAASGGEMWWLRWTRNNFFSVPLFEWIQNENEISEPEIPWAVIHTDIDGIACKPIRFVLLGAGWLLIAEIKCGPAKSRRRKRNSKNQQI